MTEDALTLLAPLLRVRPEIQDFCRFGGDWSAPHAAAGAGWAHFHIVTRGACLLERAGRAPEPLRAGDVVLLPHGDAHSVHGGAGKPGAPSRIVISRRNEIWIKESIDVEIEAELVCGRLHLEMAGENILQPLLPNVIVLHLGEQPALDRCSGLVAGIREELDLDRAGAAAIALDLASALFVILLRQHLEDSPPADGLLALLGHRETAKAAIAILREPARDWSLDQLASAAAVSRATLVRAFRRIAQIAPLAFLTELRLGIARGRIAQTFDPLGQIAADVGYQSEAALSRALHRRFAMRPGEMRRRPRADWRQSKGPP